MPYNISIHNFIFLQCTYNFIEIKKETFKKQTHLNSMNCNVSWWFEFLIPLITCPLCICCFLDSQHQKGLYLTIGAYALQIHMDVSLCMKQLHIVKHHQHKELPNSVYSSGFKSFLLLLKSFKSNYVPNVITLNKAYH